LERRPARMIPRLQEILAKPDPTLGYLNGELRFWLGWAQEVAGDHTSAQESWRQARSELEPFLKEQPDNYILIGDLALVNIGLGDKAAALTLSEQAMTVLPLEKDVVRGPFPLEILARVAAQMGEPDRAITALRKLLSIPYAGPLPEAVPLTPALLRLDPMFDQPLNLLCRLNCLFDGVDGFVYITALLLSVRLFTLHFCLQFCCVGAALIFTLVFTPFFVFSAWKRSGEKIVKLVETTKTSPI